MIIDHTNPPKTYKQIILNTKTLARFAVIQAMYSHVMKSSILLNIENVYNNSQTLLTTAVRDSMQDIINLYEIDANSMIDFNLSDNNSKKRYKIKIHSEIFQGLAQSTLDNLLVIDDVIAQNISSQWKLEKLSVIILLILRVAISDLFYYKSGPDKVIINEYVKVSESLVSSNAEVKFVNAVLDSAYRNHIEAISI